MKNRTDLPLKELSQLLDDYFRHNPENSQYKEFFGSKTQLTKSLVYNDTIPVTSQITSYEDAKQIIEKSSYGAAAMCHCRHTKHHIGRKCKKNAPYQDICIVLGNGARFLTRRGFAKEKTKQELMEIIELARSLKLTHITDNIRDRHTFICNCCGCCCEIMHGVQQGYYNGVAKTNFIATINSDLCDYCGECFTACNVKAIKPANIKTSNRRFSIVKQEVCLGCGACISSCSKNAISLIEREPQKAPPKNKTALFKSILIEKGRIAPFVLDIAKQKFSSIFKGR